MMESREAAAALTAAYTVTEIYKGSKHPNWAAWEEKFAEASDVADIRFKHAMRRLKKAFPSELCTFPDTDSWQLVGLAIQCAALGHPIPAAAAAAQKFGLPDPSDYAHKLACTEPELVQRLVQQWHAC